MKTKVLVVLLGLAVLLPSPNSQLSAAPVGTVFTYQGRLAVGGGSPDPAERFDYRFSLFDVPTGGIQLTDTVAHAGVPYGDGTFTVPLDFGSNSFTGAARWLQIEVRPATNNPAAPYTLLSPRQPLTAAPYALHAERAAVVADGSVRFAHLAPDAVGTVNLQAGAVTSDKIADGTLAAADLGSALLSNTFWRLGGNAGTMPDTHFLGTTDNTALELKVNNQRAVRITPGAGGGPNFVGGLYVNSITQSVSGSFIGGGGAMYGPNAIAADGVFLGGGRANAVRAGANYAALAGGDANEIGAGAAWSAIGGGGGHGIGQFSAYAGIFAGYNNLISSNSGSSGILLGGGGRIGESSSFAAILSGGANNIGPTASYAAIAAGGANRIESGGSYAFIGGGQANVVRTNASLAAVLSGGNNSVERGAMRSVLAGGSDNQIGPSAYNAVLGGGYANTIQFNAAYAAILGGHGHVVRSNAQWATVLGGQGSVAGAPFTIAGGHQAKAEHTGSIVLADGQYGDFASSNAYEFAVRASGGVRFVTGGTGLTVDGWKLTGGSGLLLGANSVAASNLQNSAVTSDKIADGSVAVSDLSPTLASNTFWRLGGNAGTTTGTHFLGTTDNQPVELRVNNSRVLRLEDNGDGSDAGNASDGAPNVVAGSPGNYAGAGIVGATIAGGGATNYEGFFYTNYVLSDYGTVGGGLAARIGTNAFACTIAGGYGQHIFDGSDYGAIGGGGGNVIQSKSRYGTIPGGYGNTIGDVSSYCTVGGGYDNSVSYRSSYGTVAGGYWNLILNDSPYSTISGGCENRIRPEARAATIPGGLSNIVTADYALAAGCQAQALHPGAFVWSSAKPAASTCSNQFVVGASGGFRLTENGGQSKTVELGDRYRDNAIIAWAKVAADGTIAAGARFGLTSVTNLDTGKYEITLDASAESAYTLVPMAIAEVDTAPTSAASARLVTVNQTGTNTFRVYINNGNYALVNNDFTFMVTGR